MATIDLRGRRSAADVVLQPGDPIWHVRRGLAIPGTFKTYGAIRCVVELHRSDAPSIVVVDARRVFERREIVEVARVEPGEPAKVDRRRKEHRRT